MMKMDFMKITRLPEKKKPSQYIEEEKDKYAKNKKF